MLSLSEADRHELLRLARDSITAAVTHGSLPESWPRDRVFAERCGVFVTVRVGQRLRGCIGVIDADEALGDRIVRCAACAALQDPRFPPIRPDELENLQIEISLLSPMTPILAENIEIGRHGLMIALGSQRGVLLPQVAVDHNLTVEQFLAETCRKARLPADAWRGSEAQIFGFTCEIFADAVDVAEDESSARTGAGRQRVPAKQ
jgi:AmmeMemoRadiSam system protein A